MLQESSRCLLRRLMLTGLMLTLRRNVVDEKWSRSRYGNKHRLWNQTVHISTRVSVHQRLRLEHAWNCALYKLCNNNNNNNNMAKRHISTANTSQMQIMWTSGLRILTKGCIAVLSPLTVANGFIWPWPHLGYGSLGPRVSPVKRASWSAAVLGTFIWVGQSKAKHILGMTTGVVYVGIMGMTRTIWLGQERVRVGHGLPGLTARTASDLSRFFHFCIHQSRLPMLLNVADNP